MRLRDVIELLDVRLVIELDDAERDPYGILNSFILTEEVEKGLRSILYKIDKGKGSGAFIKGNFGSGKSHFLSFLYLLLRDKKHPCLKDFETVRTLPFNIVKVSLVRYPASLSLEEILLQCLNCSDSVSDREVLFKDLFDGPSVIIIDELSEFLRSKPSAPLFYEDLRFLQFLGEFSMRHPLWVIASLQEWIEETGYISSSIFNRIKDRYPLRLNLTSSHIEDIIDQRLIKKKDGSIEVIKSIFDELKSFYPHLELRFDRFKRTYPLHPFTTRFLSGLTRVFSQHRGVIQFVQSEVRKRLDEPADSLITPDAIFDHFEDRIREIPESSSLVRVVYAYYKDNLPSVFHDQRQREIAEDVIKILILTELSPTEKRKTAKDIAEILLKKISSITARINYDYIKDGILEPLASHQMYITKDGETYFIDISQDEGLRLKARLKAVRERFHDRDYLFHEVSNLLSLPYLPLRDIKDGRRYRFRWQNSLRECIVLTSTGVSSDDIERFHDGIKKRVDGYLIILSPFHPFTPSPPHLFTDSAIYSSILLWQPREPTEEEAIFIEEYIAKTMITGEFPSLKDSLKNSDALFRETITRLYFEGKVLSISGKECQIKEIGYLPMERLLSHLLDAPLSGLYPEHRRIMPRLDIYSSHNINNLFVNFIRQGKVTVEEAERKGLIPLITGLLEPLGLVAKKGSTYTLHISPENDIISYILNVIAKERDIYRLRVNLRKSRWGPTDDQIDLLLSSLIVSGYLIPYGGQEAQELKDISQLSSGDITVLKQGRSIGNELLTAIPRGRFIWGDIETAPTPATIKYMWKEASQFIRRFRRLVDEVQSMINRYQGYSVFKLLDIDRPILNRIALFVRSFRLNMSAEEAIERVLTFLNGDNNIEEEVSYIERLYKFFDEEFQLINKYYLYLTHPFLKVEGELSLKRESLLKEIRDYLRNLNDIEGIRQGWTDFYDSYSSAYKDSHDRFYDSPIFTLKDRIEGLNSLRTLKKIAHILPSITFGKEWWEIRRKIEELPDRCRADIDQELFVNPACRCGFNFGMQPTTLTLDIPAMCEEGLKNFLMTIQSPENREKIDSTIIGLGLSGKKDLSQKLLQLLSINPEKTNIEAILPIIDEEVLEEIENAFKGRWKIKELIIDELTDILNGRRFRYDELKRLLLGWLGDDAESIIHVKSRDRGENSIMEELSIYGIEGKKAAIELANLGPLPDREELGRVFDLINLRNFEISELMDILKREKNEYMKKRLRDELFERAWGSGEWKPEGGEWGDDETIKQIFEAISIIKAAERLKGVHVFTDVIAPLSCIVERLLYENMNDRLIEHALLERLSNAYTTILREYEKRPDRYDGARDIEYVKEKLSGNIVVMDALRYDLWLILKKTMIHEGWRLKDEVFKIDSPSTTSNFRELLGINGDSGIINGRDYSLFRVAEREIGKRNLRKFLMEGEGIKFLHFNFIDTRVHGSTLDIHPLFEIIKREFITGILPILKEVGSFYLTSDHGFTDTKDLKERYRHGGKGIWETILPFAEIRP